MSTTFDLLVADLTRDAKRAQPRDALQYCADWFNARLQEQRARIRDILEQTTTPTRRTTRGYSAPNGLVNFHAQPPPDIRGLSIPQLNPTQPSIPPRDLPNSNTNGLGPLDEAPAPVVTPPSTVSRIDVTRRPSAPSPFGTLNVPGNALTIGRARGGDHPAPRSNGFNVIREEEDGLDASSHHSMTLPNPLASRIPAAQPFGHLGPPPSALGRRVSVSGESISPSSGAERPPPFFPKTPDQMKRLEEAISDAFLFRKLDSKKRNAVLGAMKEVKYNQGDVIITQGDDGDFFYVVESGTLDCYKRGPDEELASPSSPLITNDFHPKYGKKVTQYGRGGTFGELALMYFAKRAATIIATSVCTLWALDRVTFQTILLDINAATRRSYEAFLASVPLLESLNDTERAKLADVLHPREYADGEIVVREGEVGRDFFIVEDGNAEVLKQVRNAQGQLTEQIVKKYRRGDYFGELALLHRAPRAATVRAVVPKGQPKLKVAVLASDAFTRLLGPLRDLMERSAATMYHTPSSS